MKNQKKWNRSWKRSVQPRKQRAFVRNAPVNVRGNLMGAHLSKELREKFKFRSVRIRKGDKVRVMLGQFKNKIGKVERVDTKRKKVYITGVEQSKLDGSKALYPVHHSNVMIVELDLSDKRRFGEVKK
ncbi:50S ribosomal protein L24 [Candidatus Woesearchaeota archaeon]|nr:MAG: 50S ribosomal protein L24 [Candidatus Woesearchaeota archaeon]